jgi:hypothetical protein
VERSKGLRIRMGISQPSQGDPELDADADANAPASDTPAPPPPAPPRGRHSSTASTRRPRPGHLSFRRALPAAGGFATVQAMRRIWVLYSRGGRLFSN